jgi:hypothetical protein
MRSLCSFMTLHFLFLVVSVSSAGAGEYNIGAYYFPGWKSTSDYWKDLKGLPGSRSPGKAWPEREPYRGFGYAEESLKVTEEDIEWASSYGLSFFVYDWYWDGEKTNLNHAIDNHKKASNKQKMKFCLLWANNYDSPKNAKDFNTMVQYWIDSYFKDPQYLTIKGKPVVIIFTPQQLRDNSKKFAKTTLDLFQTARDMAVKKGLPGIYFIGCSGGNSYWVNNYLPANGYDAVTAHNYQTRGFSGEFTGKEPLSTSYSELIDGYKSQWQWMLTHSNMPYIVPMTAGWDRRPWGSNDPHQNSGSTPETFRIMLTKAKKVIDANTEKTLGMGIIYAWNEFGEGGYIEPTKKWGFQYLQAIKDVFGQ